MSIRRFTVKDVGIVTVEQQEGYVKAVRERNYQRCLSALIREIVKAHSAINLSKLRRSHSFISRATSEEVYFSVADMTHEIEIERIKTSGAPRVMFKWIGGEDNG